jgi:hypothetical protein
MTPQGRFGVKGERQGAGVARRAGAWLAAGVVALTALGCGGGGGGAAPADVIGRILLTTTGQPPNPAATVSVAGAAAVQTAVDGSFTIRNASSAATQIVVSAAGMTTLRQTLPALIANAVNDLGDVYMTDSTYDADVDGVIVRADTLAPITGATVVLSGKRAVSAANGAFAIQDLPVGLGGLGLAVGKVTATGFEEKPIIIDLPLGATAPPDNLVNHLGDILVSPPVGGIPGGPTTISGQVLLQGQTLHTGTTVTLIRRPDLVELGWVLTTDTGSYGFWVPAGDYRLRAERTGYQTKTVDVTLVRPDQPVTANLTLVP